MQVLADVALVLAAVATVAAIQSHRQLSKSLRMIESLSFDLVRVNMRLEQLRAAVLVLGGDVRNWDLGRSYDRD